MKKVILGDFKSNPNWLTPYIGKKVKVIKLTPMYFISYPCGIEGKWFTVTDEWHIDIDGSQWPILHGALIGLPGDSLFDKIKKLFKRAK